ncbi:MAG TPA: hypothetical protein VHG89_12990 [Verrucomicrobiae bacterium]|nr:hypothetical protein [Verrucomicrobiae bacterium]
MKTIIRQCLLPALASCALICSAGAAAAQDLVVNTFDTDISGVDWANFRTYIYGYNAVWDPTQDSSGNPNSGSLYLTVQWPFMSDPNWNESWNDVQIGFATPAAGNTTFSPSDYTSFDFDLKIDVANSSVALDGTYGALELIINNPWTTVVGWAPIAATNGWQHISGSFSGITGTNSEAVIGFISTGGGSLTNTVSYWIDNIRFTAPVTTNRPTLSFVKPPPLGLTCLSSQPGGTYQRQIIGTVGSNYSWNTATASSNTTTYSVTITNFPGTPYAGYEARFWLINGLLNGQVDSDVDYDAENCVYFSVYNNGDGSASADFRYKVNSASGENWTTLTNGTVDEYVFCQAGPLGKWSLSFNNNTNVTMTAPDGTTTSFTINASDASNFQDPLYVYLGTRPNDNSRIGQSATFNRFTITGAAASIDDNFSQFDTNTWLNSAADPNGIIVTTPDTKYWLTWPMPDGGFTNLFVTDDLKKNIATQWLALPTSATGWINDGAAERITIINQSTLNTAFGYTPTNCFFGLYHP